MSNVVPIRSSAPVLDAQTMLGIHNLLSAGMNPATLRSLILQGLQTHGVPITSAVQMTLDQALRSVRDSTPRPVGRLGTLGVSFSSQSGGMLGSSAGAAGAGIAFYAGAGAAAGPIGAAVGAVVGIIATSFFGHANHAQINADVNNRKALASQYAQVAGTMAGRQIGVQTLNQIGLGLMYNGQIKVNKQADAAINSNFTDDTDRCKGCLLRSVKDGIAQGLNNAWDIVNQVFFARGTTWSQSPSLGVQFCYDAADAILAQLKPDSIPFISHPPNAPTTVTVVWGGQTVGSQPTNAQVVMGSASAPNVAASPTAARIPTVANQSADGSSVIAGSGGSLINADGTWSLGPGPAAGNSVGAPILLNGVAQPGAYAVGLTMWGGVLYQVNAQGGWYSKVPGQGWAPSNAPQNGNAVASAAGNFSAVPTPSSTTVPIPAGFVAVGPDAVGGLPVYQGVDGKLYSWNGTTMTPFSSMIMIAGKMQYCSNGVCTSQPANTPGTSASGFAQLDPATLSMIQQALAQGQTPQQAYNNAVSAGVPPQTAAEAITAAQGGVAQAGFFSGLPSWALWGVGILGVGWVLTGGLKHRSVGQKRRGARVSFKR